MVLHSPGETVALVVEPQEVVLGLRESGDWRF
jgi:hypothetical protein